MRRDSNVSSNTTFESSSCGATLTPRGGDGHPMIRRRLFFSGNYYLNKITFVIILLLLADILYIFHLPAHTFEISENVFDHLLSSHSDHGNTFIAQLKRSKESYDGPMEEGRRLYANDDKGPIFKILQQAQIDDINALGNETLDALPTWSQITRLFGDRPHIIGLDKCEAYRESISPTERLVGVSGPFNSGTNILSTLLELNCQITERMEKYGPLRNGMRWQVPWGKHSVASRRLNYTAVNRYAAAVGSIGKNEHTNTLPVVMIRDPYQWMQSMCRRSYGSDWRHGRLHCPNLVPNKRDSNRFKKLRGLDHVPVHTYYQPDFKTDHDSLVHMWTDWYQQYLNATFPRIIVRFEDLLFRGEEVIDQVCKCAGGVMRQDRIPPHFVHQMNSAKAGRDKTNLVDALIRYGNHDHRLDNMTSEDLKYAAKHLDERIMDMFGYSIGGV